MFDGLLPKSFFTGFETFFDISNTRPWASNRWNRISFTSPRFMNKNRFNERSKRFLFGQRPDEPLSLESKGRV
jgi:hypothetical protein